MKTPLERIHNLGHKKLNHVLLVISNCPDTFRHVECTGRLVVLDKNQNNKGGGNKTRIGASSSTKKNISTDMVGPKTESTIPSISALPPTAGESHPNYKTTMCRYRDRCIYGERCR